MDFKKLKEVKEKINKDLIIYYETIKSQIDIDI